MYGVYGVVWCGMVWYGWNTTGKVWGSNFQSLRSGLSKFEVWTFKVWGLDFKFSLFSIEIWALYLLVSNVKTFKIYAPNYGMQPETPSRPLTHKRLSRWSPERLWICALEWWCRSSTWREQQWQSLNWIWGDTPEGKDSKGEGKSMQRTSNLIAFKPPSTLAIHNAFNSSFSKKPPVVL